MPSLSDDVLFSESAVEQLQASAEAAAPHETGGILLGMMGDDRRWVTAVREIPSAHPERGRYQVPANVTNGIVLEARALDPRIGYSGDWHSHPADSGASGIDLATYLWLLRRALSRSETTPLLVVVRRDAEGWQLDVTTAVAWRFRPRALAWSLVGQPSPPIRADAGSDDAAEGALGRPAAKR